MKKLLAVIALAFIVGCSSPTGPSNIRLTPVTGNLAGVWTCLFGRAAIDVELRYTGNAIYEWRHFRGDGTTTPIPTLAEAVTNTQLIVMWSQGSPTTFIIRNNSNELASDYINCLRQ